MDLDTTIETIQTLTGETDEDLLEAMITDAEQWVLAYTNRSTLPRVLEKSVRDLVVIALNRRGTEGENSRSEAGESYNFDNAPKRIYSILDRYRLARVGGRIHEYKSSNA